MKHSKYKRLLGLKNYEYYIDYKIKQCQLIIWGNSDQEEKERQLIRLAFFLKRKKEIHEKVVDEKTKL